MMAADLMDHAGKTFRRVDAENQPPAENRDRKDSEKPQEDNFYGSFRRNVEKEGVDPEYFPEKTLPNGEYEDTGADTFRNLDAVARHGMDIAMRGGTYDEIRNGMREDFERKQRLGFDMKFQNYTLTNFEMEVKRANE